MELNSIPVKPGFAGDEADFSIKPDAAQTLQCLAQDFAFLLKLKVVIGVLVLAASTIGEIFASRNNSLPAALSDFEQFTPQQARFHTLGGDLDALVRENEGNQDDLAVGAS